MKKILKLVVCSTFLMTGFVFAADETNREAAPAPASKPKISELTGVEPKKLVCSAITSLNSIFNLPEVDEGLIGMLLVSALDNSIEVLKRLDQYEKGYSEEKKKLLDKRVIVALKGGMIKSLAFSLPVLHKYRAILKILLEESLGGAGFSYADSLLYKFLQSKSEEESKTFFEKNISTKQNIRSCCIDFAVLFGDLEYTMPSVFNKGRERFNQPKK
jgi:hypothetical protein